MPEAVALPAEWIDEIPTGPSAKKARLISIATAMLVGLGAGMWHFGSGAFIDFLIHNGKAGTLLVESGLQTPLLLVFPVFGTLGLICLVSGLVSLVRNGMTYRLLRATLLTIYPIVLCYAYLTWTTIFTIVDGGATINNGVYDRASAQLLWWEVTWPALAIGLYALWLNLLLNSRSVYAAFTGVAGEPMEGDQVLEDWRTHGRDPRARRSLYGSFITHVMVIIIIPMLLAMHGCIEPFSVPKGSGVEAVQAVKPKIKKKKKKKKKLLLAKNRSIIWKTPDLFKDTEVDKVLEEKTELTYTASGKPGKLGKEGGKKGGWPEGMEDAKVRFPRLNHGGGGWDDGMNASMADVNFLREFKKMTGFKVANKGEALTVAQLNSLPEDGFPPFLYITGNTSLGRLSGGEIKMLRQYCLNGGMIVGDAGSHHFDRSFRNLMRQMFPGKQLIDISDDDVLYQQPTTFPDGAPSFWHHGGDRALGIKHEGMWVVFYHPGDMNDAWKSRGYSDVTPEMRRNAMQLGINIVAYSFNRWNDAVAKLRK